MDEHEFQELERIHSANKVKSFKTDDDWMYEIHADNIRIADGYPPGNIRTQAENTAAIDEMVRRAQDFDILLKETRNLRLENEYLRETINTTADMLDNMGGKKADGPHRLHIGDEVYEGEVVQWFIGQFLPELRKLAEPLRKTVYTRQSIGNGDGHG